MLSKAVVVPVSDFETWYFGDEDTPLPGQAKAPGRTAEVVADPALNLLNQKSCTACHSIDGSAMVGPSLKGLYGKREIVIDSKGREHEVIVDDAYLTRAIQDPGAEDVKGYPPAMPKTPLTEGELKQVVEFIKTLK